MAGEPVDREPLGERLGRAFIEAVAEHGFEGATIAQVAERAGTTTAEFTSRYPGKREAYYRIFDAEVSSLMSAILETFERGDRSWLERLRATAELILDWLRADHPRARFVVVEVRSAGADAQARRDLIIQGVAELVDRGNAEREASGGGEPVPRSTAEAISGAIQDQIYASVSAGDFDSLADVLPQMMYLAVRPYLGEAAAARELSGAQETE